MGWAEIEFKLGQAERALVSMSSAGSREGFYDGLALFLSAARSAISVLAFQYGLREFAIGEKAAGTNRHLALSQAERKKRGSFDAWLTKESAAVLAHSLKADRDADVHREGIPSAKFRLAPGAGLLVEPGGPIDRPLVLRSLPSGHIGFGLPLEGPAPEDYYFDFDSARPAIAVCREYLDSVKSLLRAAQPQV